MNKPIIIDGDTITAQAEVIIRFYARHTEWGRAKGRCYTHNWNNFEDAKAAVDRLNDGLIPNAAGGVYQVEKETISRFSQSRKLSNEG